MKVALSMSLVAVLVAGCQGGSAPSCGAMEKRLRDVVAEDQARWAGTDALYVPVLEPQVIDELVGRCRAGTLSAPFIRCASSARTSEGLDRCAARFRGNE